MSQNTTLEPQSVTRSTSAPTVTPKHQIRETNEAFVLTVWLPGVDKSSVETTVNGETLTVLGRRNFTVPAEWTPVHREIQEADFLLELEIDHRVNRDAVEAELKQGVLTLTFPKAEAVKPRRIEIQG